MIFQNISIGKHTRAKKDDSPFLRNEDLYVEKVIEINKRNKYARRVLPPGGLMWFHGPLL